MSYTDLDRNANVFVKSQCTRGFLYALESNGNIKKITSDYFYMSNIIPVNEGDLIRAYGFTPNSDFYYYVYCKNGDISNKSNILSAHVTSPTKQDGYSYAEWTVPANVNYLSIGGVYAYIDKVVVNRVSAVTPDTPTVGANMDMIVIDNVIHYVEDIPARNNLENLTTRVNYLENSAGVDSPFAGKIINCLGDSIAHGVISRSSGNPTFTQDTWPKGVADNLGCIVNNYGVSATSICNGSSESFVTRLNAMSESEIDLLLIFGGTNDYGDKRATTLGDISDSPSQGTNFYASFKYLISQAINKYPSAIVAVITPMRRSDTGKNSYGISIEDIANAEIAVANFYGVPILDFYHNGGINPEISIHRNNYAIDGLHPTQSGLDKFLIPMFTEFARGLLKYRP